MEVQAGPVLSFPDGPKLELDQLIDQLVDRARGVQRAQGRLRELLRATEMVTGELSVQVVLRHVLDAACALTSARYGALGVVAPDGSLEEFIYAGLTEDQATKIGDLPQGKGLLGALITDPEPIRRSRILDDARSSGFPPHHPPMTSFLGVPIRVRGEVFGNLYLTDSEAGHFSEEDEELVRSVAVTAGTAISNARLYSESTSQQRWLSASAEISAQLLASTGEDPLKVIARHASEIAEADLVTVALLTTSGTEAMVEVAVGEGAVVLLGQKFQVQGTLTGMAIADRVPMLGQLTADSPTLASQLDSMQEPGPVMVIPMVGTGKVLGALTIARRAGKRAFSTAELSMAAAFANHASIAIELAAARSDQQRMVLLEDRDRIARDLHDHVIQQMFAIGLSMEGVGTLVSDHPDAAQRLHELVSDIDRTIRQIRTSIFELRGPLGTGPDGLRTRVLEIAADVTPALGFSPSVVFAGPVDMLISGTLSDDVLACVREGLTNAAKHANAARVSVDVGVASNEVTVEISDDGIGLIPGTRASGTANLKSRAEQRTGYFELATRATGGTKMTWKAPLT